MPVKFTKRSVDQAAPKGDRYTMWDAELTGFGLTVQPQWGKDLLPDVPDRMGGRTEKAERYTIGRHGDPWTAEEARIEARRLLLQVANGINPKAARAAQRAKGVTVSELCDRFLDQHVVPKTKRKTGDEYRRLIVKIIKPRMGSTAVADVVRGDVVDLHHRLRDTSRQANLVLSVLSKMFNLAEVWGLPSACCC